MIRNLLTLVVLAVVLVVLPCSAGAQTAGPPPSATGATWEIYDSNGQATGYTVATSTADGYDWRYYDYPDETGDPATLVDQGTANEVPGSGGLEYTWESDSGGGEGTVSLDADGTSGSWTNTTTRTEGTMQLQ